MSHRSNSEPMMPNVERVLPSLHVSTIPSWQSVADWYADLAKDRTVPDQNIKDLVARLTVGQNDARGQGQGDLLLCRSRRPGM